MTFLYLCQFLVRVGFAGYREALDDQWTECNMKTVKDKLERAIKNERDNRCTQRLHAWKIRLQIGFEIYKHGGAAFQWIRNKPIAPIVAVRNTQGHVDTDPTLVLQNIQNAWQTLFNNTSLVQFSHLEHHLNDLITPNFFT